MKDLKEEAEKLTSTNTSRPRRSSGKLNLLLRDEAEYYDEEDDAYGEEEVCFIIIIIIDHFSSC